MRALSGTCCAVHIPRQGQYASSSTKTWRPRYSRGVALDAPGLVSSWSDQELAQLAATVGRGLPWRQALREVAQPSASDERSEHRSDDACGNWLWLVDLARWERALDVQGGIGTMTAALARHFTSVHYVDAARPPLEFARARFREDRSANVACAQAGAGALPYPNATFDCVVWDGALGRGVSGVAMVDPPAVLAAVLTECRRVLRPGGCLYVGIATGPVPGRVLPAGGILSALVRMVVRAIRVPPVRTWRREIPEDGILIVENYGAIPPAVRRSGCYVWNRGFNVVLLGRDDAPRYFCKCRPIADANLERETAVLRALHSDPELCTIVPRASGARDSEVQLQLNEFVTGWPYERALPRLTELAWVESMAQILSVARMVSRRATDLLPSLLTTPAPAPLCVAAANALRELGAVGLAADVLQGLERALAGAGAVPPLLQHGDLWPGNVLWHHGSWRLLDFEV